MACNVTDVGDESAKRKEAVTTAPTKVDLTIFEIAKPKLYQVIEESIVAFENVLGSPILRCVVPLCLGDRRRHCCYDWIFSWPKR